MPSNKWREIIRLGGGFARLIAQEPDIADDAAQRAETAQRLLEYYYPEGAS